MKDEIVMLAEDAKHAMSDLELQLPGRGRMVMGVSNIAEVLGITPGTVRHCMLLGLPVFKVGGRFSGYRQDLIKWFDEYLEPGIQELRIKAALRNPKTHYRKVL